jgi:hypothetical protein
VGTTGLVGETYVKILGKWHYLYRSVDQDGQILDCWLSRTRDLAAADALFRRIINSTRCKPEHVVTDKAALYPSAIRLRAGRKAHGHWLLQPGDLDRIAVSGTMATSSHAFVLSAYCGRWN